LVAMCYTRPMIKNLWLGLATYFVVMVFAVGWTLAAVAMLLPGVIILRITLIAQHHTSTSGHQYQHPGQPFVIVRGKPQNLNRNPRGHS